MTRHANTDLLSSIDALGRAVARGLEVRDGTDSSGTVTIIIDDDDVAHDIRIAGDWRARLAPAELGAAVVEADTAAATRRAAVTDAALESTEDTVQPAPWLQPVAPPGERRTLAELSSAVLAAFEDLDRMTQPAPPVQGCGAQGAVTVTMAHGRITGCTVNPSWLARQDDVTLAHALREAMSAAAAARLSEHSAYVDYQERLQQLVAAAKATLDDMAGGPR